MRCTSKSGGHLCVELVEQLLELDGTVPPVQGADHLSRGDLQGPEQGDGAGADVVVTAAFGNTGHRCETGFVQLLDDQSVLLGVGRRSSQEITAQRARSRAAVHPRSTSAELPDDGGGGPASSDGCESAEPVVVAGVPAAAHAAPAADDPHLRGMNSGETQQFDPNTVIYHGGVEKALLS
ncbi:hypothetical protein AB0K49_04535 [Streptomyces decoyicus]